MTRFGKGVGLFATGLAVGGLATALFTPKTGRAFRRSIQKEFRHQRRSANRLARNVAGDFRSAYSSGREAAGRVAKRLRVA